MVYVRTEILIQVCTFPEIETAVIVACHNGHILEMAFAALIAYRTIVRMIDHQGFDNSSPEIYDLLVLGRDDQAIYNRFHARHYYPSLLIIGISELFYCTLPACSNRSQCRVIAEIWYVESKCKAGVKKVPAGFNFKIFSVYIDMYHIISRDNVFHLHVS
jgi:hypothetical protein